MRFHAISYNEFSCFVTISVGDFTFFCRCKIFLMRCHAFKLRHYLMRFHAFWLLRAFQMMLLEPSEIIWDYLMRFHDFEIVMRFDCEIICCSWDFLVRCYAFCYVVFVWDFLFKMLCFLLHSFLSWFHAFLTVMRFSYEIYYYF